LRNYDNVIMGEFSSIVIYAQKLPFTKLI